MSRLDNIHAAVERTGKKAGKISGDRFRCQCPAHNGSGPNLEFKESSDGRVTFRCYSQGCDWPEMLSALGLETEDFVPAEQIKKRQHRERTCYTPSLDELVINIAESDMRKGKKLNSEDRARYQQALLNTYTRGQSAA